MIRMIGVLLLSLCLAQSAFAEDIQMTLQPINSATGNILYALYNSAASFMSTTDAYQEGSVPPVVGTQVITLTNIAPGSYAMTAFQDLNGNGKLDTGIFGMPKEPFAISNITKTLWSHPQWNDVVFQVNPGVVTELPMLMKMQ
jgi:uncharacterized protein (DUF2141 family)